MGVMDDSPRVGVFSHLTIENIVLADRAFFQRRRGEDGFESRAGLEAVRHRAIAPLFGGLFVVAIRIEGGKIRQRENLAGEGLYHDRNSRFRSIFENRSLKLLFGDVLNRRIESQMDVAAGREAQPLDAWHEHAATERVALGYG